MSADRLEQAVHGGGTLGAVIAHVGVLIFGPAALLIWAGLGMGVLVLILGAQARFKAVLSATCYANLVGVLGALMGVALILFGDPEHFNAQNPIPSNVAFFLNPRETPKPLYSLASSADILWIWTTILMAMGWSRLSGGKAKTVSIFLAFCGVWMVWVLGKVGFASLFSWRQGRRVRPLRPQPALPGGPEQKKACCRPNRSPFSSCQDSDLSSTL
jgi:hypothetical protein